MKKLSDMNSAELRGAVTALGGDPTTMTEDDEMRGFLEAKSLSSGSKLEIDWKKFILNGFNVIVAVVLFIVSGLGSDFSSLMTFCLIAALGILIFDVVSIWKKLEPDGWAEIRVFIAKSGAEFTALSGVVFYMTMVTGFGSVQPAILWVASIGLLIDAIAEIEE